MPFLIEADAAARRICDGFERAGFEICFPWQLAGALKLLRILPYALRFRLLGVSLRKAEEPWLIVRRLGTRRLNGVKRRVYLAV